MADSQEQDQDQGQDQAAPNIVATLTFAMHDDGSFALMSTLDGKENALKPNDVLGMALQGTLFVVSRHIAGEVVRAQEYRMAEMREQAKRAQHGIVPASSIPSIIKP